MHVVPGLKAKRDIYHGQFQDDNSRSERFAYVNFDIVLVNLVRVFQPSTTRIVPCDMFYVTPMLLLFCVFILGLLIGAWDSMLWPIWGFRPFFANSGFIYLSNNVMTKWFWEMVTVSLPSNPQGNQYVMRGIIELFVRNWGFKAHVLPFQKYQSGAYLSHPTNTPRHIKLKPIFPTAEVGGLQACPRSPLLTRRRAPP